MYEKTVAAIQRIYSVNLTGTPTRVIDLLSTQDREEYKEILNGNGIYPWNNIIKGRENYKRIVVDGYIICPSSAMLVSTSSTGAQETVPENLQYTSPVIFWLEELYVSGSGSAIVRIFFS